jgi:hypothetical protein
MLPYGRVLYDEEYVPGGVEMRRKRRRNLIQQAVVLLLIASVITYLFLNYPVPILLMGIAGVMALAFTLMLGILMIWMAIDQGYRKVFEKGIVTTRSHSKRFDFWPFSSIEKIAMVAPDSENPLVMVYFKQGLRKGVLRTKRVLFATNRGIADSDAFIKALEGRVVLITRTERD